MADTAARLAICARRNEVARFTIAVAGIDLTGVTMAMQIRLGRDVPGAPLISLPTVATLAAEGLKLDGVTTANGRPTSVIKGRINASTMTDATKVPYTGEVGDNTVLAYAMQWTLGGDAQTRLYGDFIVVASAFGSDGAPTNRPPSYGSPPESCGGSSSGSLTFGDQIIAVTLASSDLVGLEVAKSASAASTAVAARDGILNNAGFISVSSDLLLGGSSKISIVAGGMPSVSTVVADLALGASGSFILRAPAAATQAVASAAEAKASALNFQSSQDDIYKSAALRASSRLQAGVLPKNRIPADMVFGRGQSNATDRPYTAGAAKLSHPTSYGRTFNGGRRFDGLQSAAGNRTNFVTKASDFASIVAFPTETIGAGMADGIALRANRISLIFSAGLGSADDLVLAPGGGTFSGSGAFAGGPYNSWVGSIKRGAALLRAAGYEPQPWQYYRWGESVTDTRDPGNNVGTNTPFSYDDMIKTLREVLAYDRMHARWALHSPLYNMPEFGVSMSGPPPEKNVNGEYKTSPWRAVQSALTDFFLFQEGVYHCGGVYHLADEDNNWVHTPAQAAIILGEHVHLIREAVRNGEDWKPTHMRPFWRVGTTITIPVYTPRGELVKDTVLVTDTEGGVAGKNGLQYYYNGAEQVIQTASVANGHIVLELAADPGAVTAGAEFVHCAMQFSNTTAAARPRANFRDSAAWPSRFNSAVTLYNWLVPQIVGMAS